MFNKYKSTEIEFSGLYFNSATKTVINHRFSFKNAFQEISYRINNWINEESGWIIELIEFQYMNMWTYRPLSGSSYVQLPIEDTDYSSSKDGLLNIKNNDQKCFLWCHIRHINPVKTHPERITQTDKKLANNLNYDGVEFPMQKEKFSKIETKSNIWIYVFCYENQLTFPIYVSDQKFKKSMNLLLLIYEN